MEEKNFLTGVTAASTAAIVYILFEHFYAPMPVQWRIAVNLLTAILFVSAHVLLKKTSVIRTVSLFIFMYSIPILHRREITVLIKKAVHAMGLNEKTKNIYTAAAIAALIAVIILVLICNRHRIAQAAALVKSRPLAAAALIWTAAVTAVLIWCGLPGEKEFFGALTQWTAYFLSAAGAVVILSGLTALIICALAKIKKTSPPKSIDVCFMVCFYIILFVSLYFAFKKGELYIAVKNMTVAGRRTYASAQIIKYIIAAFGISFLSAMVAVNSVTKSFFALYGKKFAFGLRDLAGKIVGIFAPDGLIVGAATDVFELFTGKSN